MGLKQFQIISTNCDCCSTKIARTTTRWKYGPRCPGCGKILGIMQYLILGSVKAEGDMEALRLFRER